MTENSAPAPTTLSLTDDDLLNVFLSGFVTGGTSLLAGVLPDGHTPAVLTVASQRSLDFAQRLVKDPLARTAILDALHAVIAGQDPAPFSIDLPVCGCGEIHPKGEK